MEPTATLTAIPTATGTPVPSATITATAPLTGTVDVHVLLSTGQNAADVVTVAIVVVAVCVLLVLGMCALRLMPLR